MTPYGWCTVFSAGVDSLGGQYGTPFSRNPSNRQKVPKKGVPPFSTTFSVRYHLSRPCCRRFSKKSAEIPPSGPSFGGGDPHFFSKIGDSMVWEGDTFPKPCFLEGGAITPCSGAREKIFFDFFFGSDLWGTHFGTRV